MKRVQIAAPVLITCHSNADWDALSSMIGLSLIYPDAYLIFPGSMEKPLLRFFDECAQHLFAFKSPKDIDPDSVRLVVVADTRQYSRIPHMKDFLHRSDVLFHVWDHHPEPEAGDAIKAASVNCGATGSSCTLVCRELESRRIPISCEMATILGLGIYGDTGAFTYASTTPEDYRAAAWLRERHMDLPFIADLVRHDLTAVHVRALNSLIDSAAVHEVNAYHVVMAEAATENFLEDFAYLAQKFMEMEPCHVLFALANMDDKVQLVARSRVEAIDVGIICRHFGGGGHRFAASASVKGVPIPELRDAIFRQLYAQVHPDKCAKELMSSPARGMEDSQSIREAESIMNRYGLKAAPVFRRGTRQCTGYMECQMASRAVAHGLGDMPVSIYMQRNMLTVHPEAPLQRLMEIIVGARQRLVPVVDRNEVIGVVTRTDLINMFVEDPGRIPLPQRTKRERNLSKLLHSRLPGQMISLLRLAGTLGDRLGVNVFAVGGFVRDVLLSRPAGKFDDVDLVVEGNGIVFATALAKELGGRVREHRAFMTALIIYQDSEGREQRLDVATARLEYYEYPAALPTVELSSIKMDLFRRDFTINAMALRLNSTSFGSLVDFFGGQGDIQRKTIRVLHALSFVEDPTRIIRAVRFEQRYGFHISIQGEKLIRNALSLNLVRRLSGSRILHELNLIFGEGNPPVCLARLDSLGVLAGIHPALALTRERKELLEGLREVIDWYRMLYFQEEPSLSNMYLLALCSGETQESTEEILERFGLVQTVSHNLLALRGSIYTKNNQIVAWEKERRKTGTALISRFCALLAPLPLDGILYLMARTPDEDIRGAVSQYIYKWRQIKADITGEDLKKLGLAPGPCYGDIMRKILAAKLDGHAPTRESQIDLARELVSACNNTIHNM